MLWVMFFLFIYKGNECLLRMHNTSKSYSHNPILQIFHYVRTINGFFFRRDKNKCCNYVAHCIILDMTKRDHSDVSERK
ncbi:hypothetical protein RCL_jg6839.t1 [Rhizophagus clarus]|uniref:Secreted protein n=1 Tax=Rhizophagus clarus TaxID=94130 RepID=A0A8H3L998_9GLOM|nr:hypothetical protein RCL_jg6839.t1 [Rhizophagus clarus]